MPWMIKHTSQTLCSSGQAVSPSFPRSHGLLGALRLREPIQPKPNFAKDFSSADNMFLFPHIFSHCLKPFSFLIYEELYKWSFMNYIFMCFYFVRLHTFSNKKICISWKCLLMEQSICLLWCTRHCNLLLCDEYCYYY